jgi:murein DD-endopeptidase MepM/ murein hydrolase activator NlpD
MDTEEILKHLDSLQKKLPKKKAINFNDTSFFIKYLIKKAFWMKAIRLMSFIILISLILPPFYWPLSGTVTSDFLFRIKPDSKRFGLEIHHGIDIAADINTGIYSTALGVVRSIGSSEELGNYIVIKHLFGFNSIYAHLNTNYVSVGKIVLPGVMKIGSIGMTGRTTGPHLHFGIYFFRLALPPKLLLLFHSIRRNVIRI